MLEILRRDPEFREEYQTAFDIHKTASQTEADAAALEQKLAAIRSTLPKTGQA
jgi:3-methyladenine DNA glycosylase Tag